MTLSVSIVLILLLALTAAAAVVPDLVGAVFLMGAYSFFMALLWAWIGAADVSFTEAVVGAGVSTLFLLLALFQVKNPTSGRAPRLRAWLAPLAFALLAGVVVWALPGFPLMGDPAAPPNAHVAPFYIRRAWLDAHTPNIVTTVLADYRGFDTLIETTVIFAAGLACWLLLRKET